MARLTIEIPEDVRSRLEARAKQSASSLEAYVQLLLREEADLIDFDSPPDLHAGSREDIRRLVIEALKTPAIEMTDADWEQMRQNLIDRHRQSKAG